MEKAFQHLDAQQEELQKLNRYLHFFFLDNNNLNLLIDTLRLAINLGEIKTAAKLINEQKENFEDNAIFNGLAGHVMLAFGDTDEALELLVTSISQGNDDPATYLNLAHCYYFLNKFDLAISLLNEHPELNALFPSVYCVLYARVLHIADKPQLAISILEKFHTENEYTAESAGLLSLILFEQNQDHEKALKMANDALAKNPQSIESLIARTSLFLDLGHYEQALIDIQQATKFHPQNGRVWSSLAQVEFNNLNFEEAKKAAAEAVIYMNNHIGTWHLLGWAHLMLNELPDALHAFEKSYELDRRFAETHGGLAAVYAHMSEIKKANQHIKIADKLDPEGFASTYAKIVLLNSNNEKEKADSLFASAKNKFNRRINSTPQNLIEKRLYELSRLQSENKKIH